MNVAVVVPGAAHTLSFRTLNRNQACTIAEQTQLLRYFFEIMEWPFTSFENFSEGFQVPSSEGGRHVDDRRAQPWGRI
jgi:hypothetical protein